MVLKTLRRAAFLDRDGTLNYDPGYISRPEDYHLFPGVGKELRRLRDAGFLLILVTNQAGIARGLIKPEDLERVHEKMNSDLALDGAALDAIFVCPHHPDFPAPGIDSPCLCRKPAPGMVFQAREKFGIDLSRSFAIGDRTSDTQMGINAGIQPILLAEPSIPSPKLNDVIVCGNLREAVDWIMKHHEV